MWGTGMLSGMLCSPEYANLVAVNLVAVNLVAVRVFTVDGSMWAGCGGGLCADMESG